MQDRLADFRNTHLGESIVVCGCGESLNLLQNPERYITIGVNDVGRRFTPNYLVVVNPRSQFAADRFRYVSESQVGALFTQLSDLGVPHPRVITFQLGSYGGTDFSNSGVLHYTQNSPYVAICLAVHMGAPRIGVIGVDFTDHHFFGSTGVHPLTSRLDQIDREYAGLFEACRARGIEVFNLSPASRLTAFPKLSIERFAEGCPKEAALSQATTRRRIFFVHYRFLSAGDVFEQGLRRASAALDAEHVWWDDMDLAGKLERFDPELVFVVHGRRFASRWKHTLRGRRSAVWLLDEPYEVDDTSSWSGIFDSVFVNDPVTIGRHRNASYLPVAYDPGLHFCDSRTRDFEAGFVGGYNSVRERCLVALADSGRLSYVVGGPWTSPVLQRISSGLNVAPQQVAELYRRTKIVINVFRETHHFNRAGVAASSLNPRVYEALACGALVVSEPRGEVGRLFPSLPTFSRPDELLQVLAALNEDPACTQRLLDDCRLRLRGHSYADRLAQVIRVALNGHAGADVRIPTQQARLPAGWIAAGAGIASFTNEEITIRAGISEENGLTTENSFTDVCVSFELNLDATCRFIAKIHHSSQGDRNANSYHLVISPEYSCLARHNTELGRTILTRHTSQRIEIAWSRGTLTASVDGCEVFRCFDTHLPAGFCAIGATGGTARVRNLRAQAIQAGDTPLEPSVLPAGWIPVGTGASSTDGEITIAAGSSEETGLVTDTLFGDVRFCFDVYLDSRCRFIAKIHQASRGDRTADSYHLVSTPQASYIARHNSVFANVSVPRNGWHRIEFAWRDGVLSYSADGREICRHLDRHLRTGFCAFGATGGMARLRNLRVEPLQPVQDAPVKRLDGWHDPGASARLRAPNHILLRAFEGQSQEVSLISERDYNDVELEFTVQLSSDAAFIAKVHAQDQENGEANSYHLASTRSGTYIARHGRVFDNVPLARGGFQHVLMRWVDQYLELRINGILHLRVLDLLLQSGYCMLAVSSGEAEFANIAVRDVSDSVRAPAAVTRSRDNPASIPFTSTPRRNLIYHVWPVRGRMWQWNLEQLKRRIDLFNGRRLIGIVHDGRSEGPEAVRTFLEGHGCEFVEVPNNSSGEVATFPMMLRQVASGDVNEVTFYGHAKGVRHEPAVPATVQRWAEVSYRATLDDWLRVRTQLEQFALTGSFRMLGRFRAHQYAGSWHYSGTYYWLRHALVFSRGCFEVPSFYGGVEAWPGIYFSRDEAGCLLFDDLRQLPYHEEFWRSLGPEVARWEAGLTRPVPPPDLAKPLAFEGFEEPRLEQKPDEFEWLLDRLVESRARSLLTIGAMHGGVEWHVARRFRNLGRDIRITAVEIRPQRHLIATMEDGSRQFGQQIEIVPGDSSAIATRKRIAPQYDAVFIDGDHSYRGSRADFELALSLHPRLIGLHDIVDSDWHAQAQCCVSRLWAELRERYVTEERTSGVWGGIGMVYPHEGSHSAVV
jgi:hypothetical protein